MELRVSAALDERIEVWFREHTEAKFDTVDLARTAIRAMREPTADMNNAGDDHSVVPANIWRVMIDEASPSSEVSK